MRSDTWKPLCLTTLKPFKNLVRLTKHVTINFFLRENIRFRLNTLVQFVDFYLI